MTLAIFLIISVFLAAVQAAVPYLVKRSLAFGVSVPEPAIKSSKVMAFKRNYSITVLFLSLVSLTTFTVWALNSKPPEELVILGGTAIQFGIIFISMSLYFYYHAKMLQLKKAQKWGESVKQVKMTDLSARTQDAMLPWYVYVLPMFVTVWLIGYSILQYDSLPSMIPTHWGINGEPDAFTPKTFISAISMPLVLLVMQIMFLGIQLSTKHSGIKLSASNANASRNRQLHLRKYSSWFMFVMSVLLTMLFSFFQLTTIHPDIASNTVMFGMPVIFLIIVLLGTIVFSITVGRSDKQIASPINENISDFDEDQYWKGGLFYFNKNDPSIFVEKRFGVGWTLNFANPIGYLVIFAPIIVILLLSFL